MKPLKNYFKPISFLLSIIILLQGCTVYKRSPVSLDEAIQAQTMVKIEKKNGEIEKHDLIVVLENGEIFGKKFKRNNFKKNNSFGFYELTAINKEQISKIQLKDKKASRLLTSTIPLVISALLIAKISYDLNNLDLFGD